MPSSSEMLAPKLRYLHLLIVKLEQKDDLDVALCDRIERVLGVDVGRGTQSSLQRTPQISDVIKTVAGRYGLTPEALTGPSRGQPTASARHLAMRVAREVTGATYPQIGRAFNREHSTVIHAMEVTEGMATGDIREELEHDGAGA